MRRRAAVAAAALALPVLLASSAAPSRAICPPCSPTGPIVLARHQLEEAFRLALRTGDCTGLAGLKACQQMEELVAEAAGTVDDLFEEAAAEGEPDADCLSCDPAPYWLPVVDGLVAVAALLRDRGHPPAAALYERLVERRRRFQAARCPCGDGAEEASPVADAAPTDPEAEARETIRRKCGEDFVRFRRGLRQVLRVPGDREGCYQSRACRGAQEYHGYDTEPGFWTYDGEFWYIWAERRTPAGEWIGCHPEER